MWMWTVGYTVGDMVYIAQTTADQQQANRVSKVLWVIALSCVLAYTGYQTYECYLSYTNPDWSSGVKFETQLDFPVVLACPIFPKRDFFAGSWCNRHNQSVDVGQKCDHRVVWKEEGLFKGRECIEFNNNASNVMTAVIEEHIFLEVGFGVKEGFFSQRNPPFAVMLNSAPDAVTEYTSFMVIPDAPHWITLSQQEDIYLHGSSKVSFFASAASTFSRVRNLEERRVMMTFSYSSFAVSVSEQVVTFDWLSLICTVGGAATFACYLHEIAMIIYAKGRQWCCALCCARKQSDDAEAIDDADADEEASHSHGAGVGADEAPPPTSAPQAVPYQVRRSRRRSRVLVPADLVASDTTASPQPRRRIFV